MKSNFYRWLVALLCILSVCGSVAEAQTEGTKVFVLKGQVTEEATGDTIPFINILLKQKEKLIAGTSCDFDGLYEIKLDSNRFDGKPVDVVVSYVGFQKKVIKGVTLLAGAPTYLNVTLKSYLTADVRDYEIILINAPFFPEFDSGKKNLYKEEIQKNPSRDINEILTTQPFILGF